MTRVTTSLKKLPDLLHDLNICMVDPLTLTFSFVDRKRGTLRIDLTDVQTTRLKKHIEDEELKARYA